MLSKTQAELVLGSNLKQIRDCVVGAFQKYRSDYSANALVHTARSRASIIHDHMIASARATFANDKGVRIFSKRGLSLINVKDSLLLRFKKMDKEKRTRNILTQQSFLFRAQLELPGIPAELTHLEAGYVLNDLQTALDGVYITCPNGKALEWFIDLSSLAGTNVAHLPQSGAPQNTSQAPRRKRIGPKIDRKDKKDEGDKS
jgi:hypothetical protein